MEHVFTWPISTYMFLKIELHLLSAIWVILGYFYLGNPNITMENHNCSLENSLNFFGHLQVRNLLVITEGYIPNKKSNYDT